VTSHTPFVLPRFHEADQAVHDAGDCLKAEWNGESFGNPVRLLSDAKHGEEPYPAYPDMIF